MEGIDERVTRDGRCPNCDRWLDYTCVTCRDIDHGAYIEWLQAEVERLQEERDAARELAVSITAGRRLIEAEEKVNRYQEAFVEVYDEAVRVAGLDGEFPRPSSLVLAKYSRLCDEARAALDGDDR